MLDLDDALVAALRPVPEVAIAYLFGSRGAGRARADSDVDVAVIFAPNVDPARRFELRCELSDRLAAAVRVDRADVVDLEAASPLLAHEVLRRGRLLLSRDEPLRTRVVALQVMRYIDTAPMRRVLDDAVFRRLQEGTFGRLT
jgi:predicted nucleotidyltransferase